MENKLVRIGIIGGGPAGLFMYKRLIESGCDNLHIMVFEKKKQWGAGMPYSTDGAGPELVTNVSDNEIPPLVTSIEEWLQTAPPQLYETFGIHPENFNEYKVLPRLLFGQYLSAQFQLLYQEARKKKITTTLLEETEVLDIADDAMNGMVQVATSDEKYMVDHVVICTGHRWPKQHEGKTAGWFDSPYPPQKLDKAVNFPVAIKGASLTAVDAVRTLARANGHFTKQENGQLTYQLHEGSSNFRLVLHALDGLLPALRFHLDDPLLHRDYKMSAEEIEQQKEANGGFVSLDYVFERTFKRPIQSLQPEFYEEIKEMQMEEFVAHMMTLREELDPFVLFKAEYAEAEKSIRRKQSVYWKEMLAVLSYALNYSAKHLSAEDMLRMTKVLMPLVSIVIAFVPQGSYRELIALYDAGVLSLVAVDTSSKVKPLDGGGARYSYTNSNGHPVEQEYKMYIDATGQPSFMHADLPFEGLVSCTSPAYIAFKDQEAGSRESANNKNVFTDIQENYFLQVPGIQINDCFQVMDRYGCANNRIYMMAVPYISGLNPDYSGLDFCEEASTRIAAALLPAKSQ